MAKGGGKVKDTAKRPAGGDVGSHRASTRVGPEDADLWHQVAQTIKPLRVRRPPPKSPPSQPAVMPDSAVPSVAITTAVKTKAKPPLPELTSGIAAGLDKRTGQRLARGQLTIEGRLDLHGLTQDEAHGRLVAFIRRSVAAGKRTVLVITGKGLKPSGETGVLRQAVPRWLNQPDLRRHIVALRQAQPKDGGAGALYLLLRRERGDGAANKPAAPIRRLSRRRAP